MEKLELKQIKGYLGTGVECEHVKDSHHMKKGTILTLTPYSLVKVLNGTIKMRLRPLSDLKNEVNSFLSVPYIDLMNELHEELKVYMFDEGEIFIEDKCELNMFHISYTRLFDDFLFSHHFDCLLYTSPSPRDS